MPLPLVERSEEEIAQSIRRKIEAIETVRGVRELTVRLSGKRLDVGMLILLDDNLGWEDTHKIASDVESAVMKDYPYARITIHTGPAGNGRDNVWRLVKGIAEAAPGSRGVHNIHIQRIGGGLCVDLHLEVSADITVKQAHDVSEQVEKKIRAADPNISEITIHIETASERISRELAGVETELESYVNHIAKRFPEIKNLCGIKARKVGDELHLVLQCQFDPNLSIKSAHEISSRLEKEIRNAYPNITRIDVHEEPA